MRLIAHDASTKNFLGYTKIGMIDIKGNCFIGDSVIVLPNVTIGPNSIVGAGSVVTKDIPPNILATGNPAKAISTVEDYMKKVKAAVCSQKKLFDEKYYIQNLDEKKRKDIIESIGDSIGIMI